MSDLVGNPEDRFSGVSAHMHVGDHTSGKHVRAMSTPLIPTCI